MSNKLHFIIVRAFFIFLLITGVSAIYYFWPTINDPDSRFRGNDNLTTERGSSAPSALSADYGRNDSQTTSSMWYGNGTTNDERDSSTSSLRDSAQNDNKTTSSNQNENPDSRFRGNDNIAQRYNITIFAGDRTYPLSVTSSTTVYEAMQLLQIDSRQPFTFSAKNYPGMGYFIEEINGIKNDTKTNTYWIMYVNGQSAQVGASQYILKPNDIITWKYEAAKF